MNVNFWPKNLAQKFRRSRISKYVSERSKNDHAKFPYCIIKLNFVRKKLHSWRTMCQNFTLKYVDKQTDFILFQSFHF